MYLEYTFFYHFLEKLDIHTKSFISIDILI